MRAAVGGVTYWAAWQGLSEERALVQVAEQSGPGAGGWEGGPDVLVKVCRLLWVGSGAMGTAPTGRWWLFQCDLLKS